MGGYHSPAKTLANALISWTENCVECEDKCQMRIENERSACSPSSFSLTPVGSSLPSCAQRPIAHVTTAFPILSCGFDLAIPQKFMPPRSRMPDARTVGRPWRPTKPSQAVLSNKTFRRCVGPRGPQQAHREKRERGEKPRATCRCGRSMLRPYKRPITPAGG